MPHGCSQLNVFPLRNSTPVRLHGCTTVISDQLKLEGTPAYHAAFVSLGRTHMFFVVMADSLESTSTNCSVRLDTRRILILNDQLHLDASLLTAPLVIELAGLTAEMHRYIAPDIHLESASE